MSLFAHGYGETVYFQKLISRSSFILSNSKNILILSAVYVANLYAWYLVPQTESIVLIDLIRIVMINVIPPFCCAGIVFEVYQISKSRDSSFIELVSGLATKIGSLILIGYAVGLFSLILSFIPVLLILFVYWAISGQPINLSIVFFLLISCLYTFMLALAAFVFYGFVNYQWNIRKSLAGGLRQLRRNPIGALIPCVLYVLISWLLAQIGV